MSHTEKTNRLVKLFEERIRESVSLNQSRMQATTNVGDVSPAGIQTRVIALAGRLESEQIDASKRDYMIEVRVRAPRQFSNFENPSEVELQSLLDGQVRCDLQAIAERYPRVAEAHTRNEVADRSMNLLQLLGTLM